MKTGQSAFGADWTRVQQVLRREHARLALLTGQGASRDEHAAEIEAVRAHIAALQELAEAVAARIARETAAFDRARYSVLVADDHDATRYAISRELRARGYRTVEARGGAEALQLSEFVSALVLDVHLPDLHGHEVCRLVRRQPRTCALPIVHVSAVHRSYADREASRFAGADDFLSTPLDFHILSTRLDGLLGAGALAG